VVSAEIVDDACDPPPIITPLLVKEAALVTHVVQVKVPVVVIVPPPRGAVVAMDVTVPDPAGVAQVLSPRRNVVPLGVPVALKSAIAINEIVSVIVGEEYA
jgi:hypothetical protein